MFPGDVQEAVQELFKAAEEQRPYKISIVGWVLDTGDGKHTWRRSSCLFPRYEDMMDSAKKVARHFSDRPFGGVAFGQGVRSLRPPPHSVGVLMFWATGSDQYATQEHWESSTIKLKDLVPFAVDDLCFVYLYFYNHMEEEPRKTTSVDAPATPIPTVPMELETLEPDMDTTDLIDYKRKGPEKKKVVIGTEAKKQRNRGACDGSTFQRRPERGGLHGSILLDVVEEQEAQDWFHRNNWSRPANMPIYSLLDAYMNKCLYTSMPTITPDVGKTLVTWPGKTYSSFLVDLQDGSSFKVDTDTDNITEDEIYPIWDQVEEAEKEGRS